MSAADWQDKMNLTLFEILKYEQPWKLETYRKIGGYEVWERILREKPTPATSGRKKRPCGRPTTFWMRIAMSSL